MIAQRAKATFWILVSPVAVSFSAAHRRCRQAVVFILAATLAKQASRPAQVPAHLIKPWAGAFDTRVLPTVTLVIFLFTILLPGSCRSPAFAS